MGAGQSGCLAPFGFRVERERPLSMTVEEIGKGWPEHHTGKRNVYALSCE